jgi:hypothetical protein
MRDLPNPFGHLDQKYGLPGGILRAVMEVESGGNPNAIGTSGERGAFQFMDETAKQFGLTNPHNTEQAAEAAAQYLASNYKKFGSWNKAVAAYNAGDGAIAKRGIFNQDYVRNVQNAFGRVLEAVIPAAEAAEHMQAPAPHREPRNLLAEASAQQISLQTSPSTTLSKPPAPHREPRNLLAEASAQQTAQAPALPQPTEPQVQAGTQPQADPGPKPPPLIDSPQNILRRKLGGQRAPIQAETPSPAHSRVAPPEQSWGDWLSEHNPFGGGDRVSERSLSDLVTGEKPQAQAPQRQANEPKGSRDAWADLAKTVANEAAKEVARTAPKPELSRSEKLADVLTSIPKGLVEGIVGDVLGTPGDIYDIGKKGRDYLLDKWMPEWMKKVNKATEDFLPIDPLFDALPGSDEIIGGLKKVGVPLDPSKTRAGRYIRSFERGAGGASVGPARWIPQLMKVGGIAGAAGEAGEEATGSHWGRTGAAVTSLLLSRQHKLSNAGRLIQEDTEFLTHPELRAGQQLMEDSHRVKFPLLAPEVLPHGPIQGLAADTLASPSGGQLLASLLKERPAAVARIKDRFLAHVGAPHVIPTPPNIQAILTSTEPGSHEAIRALAASDPTAFRAYVANHIERTYEAAATEIRGAPSLHSGWTFQNQLTGTPQRKRNFEAMIEALPAETKQEINTTLKVLSASGKLEEIGETAGRTRAEKMATRYEGRPKTKAGKASRERVANYDRRSRKTYIDLAQAMGSEWKGGTFSHIGNRVYNPNALLNMLDLADLHPGFPLLSRANARRHNLGLTGVRADGDGVTVTQEDDERVKREREKLARLLAQ